MISVKLNNLRISPRKVRLTADLIRGMKVAQAQVQLSFLGKRSANPILKLLNSAIANAKNNFKISEKKLFVSKIFVDCGPVLKRQMPRAFGRSAAIMKRTSHITLVLEEKADITEKAEKREVKAKKIISKKKITNK